MFQFEHGRYFGVGVDQRLGLVREACKQPALSPIEYGDTQQFDPFPAHSSVVQTWRSQINISVIANRIEWLVAARWLPSSPMKVISNFLHHSLTPKLLVAYIDCNGNQREWKLSQDRCCHSTPPVGHQWGSYRYQELIPVDLQLEFIVGSFLVLLADGPVEKLLLVGKCIGAAWTRCKWHGLRIIQKRAGGIND